MDYPNKNYHTFKYSWQYRIAEEWDEVDSDKDDQVNSN